MRLSFSICQFTYLRIFSSSRPTVLTQYPLAQKCLPQYRFFRWIWRSNIFIALLPFRKPTTSAIEYLGGIDSTKWTWSNWTFFSSTSNFFHSHSCWIISITDFATSPFRMRNRYLGHQTIWYLQSQTACANFCNSFIKYLLQTFRVTARYLKEVFAFYHHVTSIA
jgi:hypothetical protein